MKLSLAKQVAMPSGSRRCAVRSPVDSELRQSTNSPDTRLCSKR